MTTCRELIEFLDDYVAGELPPERRESFQRHLTNCPSCTAYLDSYRTTIQAAKTTAHVEIEDIPPEVLVAILASLK